MLPAFVLITRLFITVTCVQNLIICDRSDAMKDIKEKPVERIPKSNVLGKILKAALK